jgi:hypothetical protein
VHRRGAGVGRRHRVRRLERSRWLGHSAEVVNRRVVRNGRARREASRAALESLSIRHKLVVRPCIQHNPKAIVEALAHGSVDDASRGD